MADLRRNERFSRREFLQESVLDAYFPVYAVLHEAYFGSGANWRTFSLPQRPSLHPPTSNVDAVLREHGEDAGPAQ